MTRVSGEARSARERLLAAADELFYREGIHSVGIDRIIEKAGVAKASLYKSFRSKDDLVAAYLDSRRRRVTDRVEAAVAEHTDPREKILAVFDSQLEAAGRPGFNGCAFANATAESHTTTVDEATANYRQWFLDLFTGLAREAGAPDPASLGRQLRLLYDGVTHSARIDRDAQAVAQGREVAALLLDSALSKRRRRTVT
jgi:AcrR family transcriptional regulator